MKTNIVYTVSIDWEKETVKAKENGVKKPLYSINNNNKKFIAAALRSVAWGALERAAFIEKQDSVFDIDIIEQAEKMQIDYCLPFH